MSTPLPSPFRSWFLNIVAQKKDLGLLAEMADSKAGIGKYQDELEASSGARK